MNLIINDLTHLGFRRRGRFAPHLTLLSGNRQLALDGFENVFRGRQAPYSGARLSQRTTALRVGASSSAAYFGRLRRGWEPTWDLGVFDSENGGACGQVVGC